MRRRSILAGAGAIPAGLMATLPRPAIAQGIRQLKMVTDWPAGMPGPHPISVRIAQTIGAVTDGRLRVEVFPAGTLVRAFETFDAVGAGVAEMYHSYEGYFASRSPALSFFAAIPFGLTADEVFAWVRHADAQKLWDSLSGQFNIKALLCANTGCQMGGWFTREVASTEAFKGLRYRMAGPGAEVLRRLGAAVVSLPGGEITSALKSGAIDASEWIGPWLDMAMGLHKSASYYYYPGFHEPSSGWSLGFNRGVWDSLAASDRQLIEAVAAAEYMVTLSEFNAKNAAALKSLREDDTVKIRKFDDRLLKELYRISMDVVAEAGAGDDISRKIYASYQQFRATAMAWGDVADRAYLNGRALG